MSEYISDDDPEPCSAGYDLRNIESSLLVAELYASLDNNEERELVHRVSMLAAEIMTHSSVSGDSNLSEVVSGSGAELRRRIRNGSYHYVYIDGNGESCAWKDDDTLISCLSVDNKLYAADIVEEKLIASFSAELSDMRKPDARKRRFGAGILLSLRNSRIMKSVLNV